MARDKGFDVFGAGGFPGIIRHIDRKKITRAQEAVHRAEIDVIGIDVGITMLMAENLRTAFVWETFMKNPEAQRGMANAGFKPYTPTPPPAP